MKRHLSIFMLFVRSSVYRVLLVMAAMVLTEAALVYVTMEKYLAAAAEGLRGEYALTNLMSDAGLRIVFLIAFVLVTVILCRFGCDFSGKLEYTIQRLSVSPISIFFWQAGYHALTYVLLWMVQVYAAFGFCLYYLEMADVSWVTNQTLFLEFYRSPFLFSIFPMEAVGIWVTNVMMVLCLGVVTARVPHAQRRRKIPFGFLITMLCVATVLWEGWGLSKEAVPVLIIFPLIIGMTIFYVYLTEPGLDEE